MQLTFYGKQKAGIDSFSFFQKLEELGLDYYVDIPNEVITISKIKKGTRDQIVKIVKETFTIETITTETITSREKVDIEDALKKIEDTLEIKNFKPGALNRYVNNLCKDLKLMELESKSCNIIPGEILSCEFGLARKEENYGNIHVLVLRKTLENKYWVVPININPIAVCDEEKFYMKVKKDEDAIYYNSTYKSENAILYLNRLQEVSSVRLELTSKFGKVTDKFLLEVKKRVASLCMDGDGIKEAPNKSLNDILAEKIISPALEKSKEGCLTLNIKTFCNEMKIPTDSIYLSKAFTMAYAHKSKTLGDVIGYLLEDEGLSGYETYKIEKPLRKEFLEWMKSEHYDIYITHTNISLGNVLKVFINSLEKR